MPVLHLLPGETRGDTAEIVLTPSALELLLHTLQEARDHGGYSCARFKQRDGGEYTVCVDVLEDGHRAWRDRPLAYMMHQIRHVSYDARAHPYDASLLATDLYAARKAKRHDQRQAAAAMGLSVGFVSYVENGKSVPLAKNFAKLFEYMGTKLEHYTLDT